KKKAIQNSENQPVSSEKDQDLDSIKLSDSHIYYPDDVKDPVICRGKEYLKNIDGEDSETSVYKHK
ncbi:25017_t:CDS:2, partial [Racocetra persica]